LPKEREPTQPKDPASVALPRQVKVLAAIAVVVALGFGIVGPALPLLAKQFGVGHAVAGLAISVFAFLRFASAFANGRLVERYGERAVLALGLALQSVTTIAAGLAPTFNLVIAFRAVGGLGSAAFTVSALALVLRTSAPEIRARAASLYQGGFLVGAVGGPAIGGFLAQITPRLPFIVYGVLLAVAGVIGMSLLGGRSVPAPAVTLDAASADHHLDAVLAERNEEGMEVPPALTNPAVGSDLAAPRQPNRPGLRSRAFAAALMLNLGSGWTLYGLRNSLVPIFGVEKLHHSAGWVGLCFLAASLVQVVILLRAGRWADAYGRRPTMLIGASAGCAACVALMLPPQTVTFLLAMIGLGAAAAFISSAPPAVVGDVSGGSGGTGVALFSMSSDFGAVIGPILGGLLADRYSYAVAFGTGAIIFGLGIAMTLIMQETGARQVRVQRDLNPAGVRVL